MNLHWRMSRHSDQWFLEDRADGWASVATVFRTVDEGWAATVAGTRLAGYRDAGEAKAAVEAHVASTT